MQPEPNSERLSSNRQSEEIGEIMNFTENENENENERRDVEASIDELMVRKSRISYL